VVRRRRQRPARLPIRSLMAEPMKIKNPSRCSHVRFTIVQRE
jgi:hypothetical protein